MPFTQKIDGIPTPFPQRRHFSEGRDPITTLIFPNFGLDKGANLNSHNNINTQHRHCLSLVIASTSSFAQNCFAMQGYLDSRLRGKDDVEAVTLLVGVSLGCRMTLLWK